MCISGKLTWIKIITRPKICPRAGHVIFHKGSNSKGDEEVMVFGGGDNAGSFFDDLPKIQIVAE
jgi:hypothetical protein